VSRVVFTALALAAATAAGCRTAPVRPSSPLPYHDDISLRGFAEEVLLGYGTPRTHRFDDYSKGSYHVRSRELAGGLFLIAPTYKLRLQAVTVVGPSGPLWAFDVIALLLDEQCTRVNWVVMPHARITMKRSGCVSPQSASSFLADMRELTPSREPVAPDADGCVVVSEAGELRSSRFECYSSHNPSDLDRLRDALDRLSKGLTVTYMAYPPVER